VVINRIIRVILIFSALLLFLTLTSNIVNVSASGHGSTHDSCGIGPPIGEMRIKFSPNNTVEPNQEVTITIEWWVTNDDYKDYQGPFRLKIELEKNDDSDVEEWEMDINVGPFGYRANELNPYNYSFTKTAPNQVGNYTLEVQITATDLNTCVKHRPKNLLVGSDEAILTTIPEFQTVAIPAALIIGVLFVIRRMQA